MGSEGREERISEGQRGSGLRRHPFLPTVKYLH